jgi:hypothetical protein
VEEYFENTAYEILVNDLHEEMLNEFTQILKVCKDRESELFTWDMPTDMPEVVEMLASYQDIIVNLHSFVENYENNNDIVYRGMNALQDHLVGELSSIV